MKDCYKNIKGYLQLPIKINNDRDYLSELKNTYIKYTQLLKDSKIPESIICQVNKNCSQIIDAINCYYNGNVLSAQKYILEILQEYKNNQLVISDVNKSYAFRGMLPFYNDKQFEKEKKDELNFFKARVSDEDVILGRKDMLHIPFDNRGIVKTQRFSIPGIPCLYLGTSSYVCWLELGKPQNSRFNVSSYKIKGDLKVLNLVLCWGLLCGASSGIDYGFNSEMDDDDIIETCLFLLPLVIATSFVVLDKNRTFKSEYIISQLIMLCLNYIDVDAVAYISKRVNTDYIGYPNAVNIAIPMKQNTDEKLSLQCNQIELTKPINFEEFCKLHRDDRWSYNRSYITKSFEFNNKIILSEKRIDYGNTIFSEFDNYLIQLEHKII